MMNEFVCPVSDCQKKLSRLQVMHFRASHECDPSEWVTEQYGPELEEKYESGVGSYAIAAEYEWLTPDMVCEVVDTRSHDDAVSSDNNPMKRAEVAEQFRGEGNPAKRPDIRKKISATLSGYSHSQETKEKISRKNSGNEITEQHRQKISEASSKRDTSYMQTEEYREALSEALTGREPTYPTPYDVDELSHSVRSSWEEEIAMLLAENGFQYVYEEEFELSVGSYYADFVVDEVVIEVKGFSNERSVKKAAAFIDEYREYTYVVVGDQIPCDVHIPWEERDRMLEVLTDER